MGDAEPPALLTPDPTVSSNRTAPGARQVLDSRFLNLSIGER